MKFHYLVLFTAFLPGTFGVFSSGLVQSVQSGLCWEVESTILDQPDVTDVTENKTLFRLRKCDMQNKLQHFEYESSTSIFKVAGHE